MTISKNQLALDLNCGDYHSDIKQITSYLFSLLPKEQVDTVFSSEYCDIEPEFLGFVDTYYYLSKVIPKHFRVIDLGCGYNPQCYFFKEHKEYIAVDYTISKRNAFYTDNTTLVQSSIRNFVQNWEGGITTTFVICNYVNGLSVESKLEIIGKFTNLYFFYPAVSNQPLRKK